MGVVDGGFLGGVDGCGVGRGWRFLLFFCEGRFVEEGGAGIYSIGLGIGASIGCLYRGMGFDCCIVRDGKDWAVGISTVKLRDDQWVYGFCFWKC